VVRVGEVVMLSIMASRDDNGCRCAAGLCLGRGAKGGRVSSPRPVRERIEGEGPCTVRDSLRALFKIQLLRL
jgi:hypothetical protein